MDLAPYTCRGFPGDFDRLMRDVPVAGIDRAQTHAMIRLCDETESILYGPDFSPRKIRYRDGLRPDLVSIAAKFCEDSEPNLNDVIEWVRTNVRHPHFVGHEVPPDRALSEEDLIASGVGWCNEQCRVFIGLCQVMEIPARLCFLFHANGRTAHTACEVFDSVRWALVDVTYGISVAMEARLIRSQFRRSLDRVYASPLAEYYQGRKPPIDIARGGDLFDAIGITNYLIDGVEALKE
jgi:hypothetical protein